MSPGGDGIGLRVDVDTRRGMSRGVPGLLDVLRRTGARSTFFLSFGPDTMGRAVFQILRRPGFLAKMLRTRAASTYGLGTVLSGTLLPPRPVARDFPDLCRRIRDAGHEVAVHAWDHRRWQDRLAAMGDVGIRRELGLAFGAFRRALGEEGRAFAAPGWSATVAALRLVDSMGLDYTSNARGAGGPFLPVLAGEPLRTPDVPVDLPTLDEELGREGLDAGAFHDRTLARLDAPGAHVYTIHAETEGMIHGEDFEDLLLRAGPARFRPLREILAGARAESPLSRRRIRFGEVPGRAGAVVLAR